MCGKEGNKGAAFFALLGLDLLSGGRSHSSTRLWGFDVARCVGVFAIDLDADFVANGELECHVCGSDQKLVMMRSLSICRRWGWRGSQR